MSVKETLQTGGTGFLAAASGGLLSLMDSLNVVVRCMTGIAGLVIAILTIITLLRRMPKKKHHDHEK